MSTLQQRICGRTAVPRRYFVVAALSAWFAIVLILAAPVATHADVFMVTDEGDSGANQPSSADGELQLTDSRATFGSDVIVGIDGGVSIIHSGTAIIRSNPSFLDIAGDLVLENRAVLDLGIEGLVRPDDVALGTYSAIDAANATLAGELILSFNFPDAAIGDMFELIRLDETGTFTGFFDDTTVTGLTGGLTADAAIMGNSLFATIMMGAAMLDGDYNDSGNVEQGDLDLVLLTWGDDITTMPLPSEWMNQRPTDGIIGQAHLDAVLLNWGNSLTAGSIAAIPEPTSCSLVLVFGAVYTAWLAATRQIPIRRGERSANVAPTADVN